MAVPTSKVSLKLLIDRNSERVLFAEASKEFMDFLFNLFRLPLGTVTSLLTENSMVGCLGKVYKSIENLSDDYLLNPSEARDVLLKPSVPVSGYLLPTIDDLIRIMSMPIQEHQIYTCVGGIAVML